jgi:hypothetical protein
VTLDRTVYNLLFRQEVVTAPVTAIFSSLSHSSGILLKYNIIIILSNCKYLNNNNNNTIINNNYGSLQDQFCSSKFSWAREKKNFGILLQFGHAVSKRFTSPVLTSFRRTVEEPNCLMYLAYTALRLFLNHFLNSSFQRTVEEPNCPYVLYLEIYSAPTVSEPFPNNIPTTTYL